VIACSGSVGARSTRVGSAAGGLGAAGGIQDLAGEGDLPGGIGRGGVGGCEVDIGEGDAFCRILDRELARPSSSTAPPLAGLAMVVVERCSSRRSLAMIPRAQLAALDDRSRSARVAARPAVSLARATDWQTPTLAIR
jgi:hypothetical protein